MFVVVHKFTTQKGTLQRLGFRVVGCRDLGFRVFGFWVLWFRGLGV